MVLSEAPGRWGQLVSWELLRPLEKDSLGWIHQGRPEARTEGRSRGSLSRHSQTLGSSSYTWNSMAGRDSVTEEGLRDGVSFRAERLSVWPRN